MNLQQDSSNKKLYLIDSQSLHPDIIEKIILMYIQVILN